MQLGSRWQAGDAPHRSVPGALHQEILAQELANPDANSWTLTWLEGRPRCTLDGQVTVTLTPQGRVVVESGITGDIQGDEDDDWLN